MQLLSVQIGIARRTELRAPVTDIKTTGFVHCDQPRVLDFGTRDACKINNLHAPIVAEVMTKLALIFGCLKIGIFSKSALVQR